MLVQHAIGECDGEILILGTNQKLVLPVNKKRVIAGGERRGLANPAGKRKNE